jgi:polyhydroxyalkanoate synthesis repressor PhaR
MAILIKRYANRKLYNTETSRYITLKGIAKLLDEGEEVCVIDKQTGEDITQVALGQILVGNQRAKEDPSDTLLTQILSRGGDALYGAIKKSVDEATDGIGDFQDRFRHFVKQSESEESASKGSAWKDRSENEHRSPFAGASSGTKPKEGTHPFGMGGAPTNENTSAADDTQGDNGSARAWPRMSGLPDLREAIQAAVGNAFEGSPLRNLGELPDFGDFARKRDFDTLNANLTRVADAIERLEATLRENDSAQSKPAPTVDEPK